MCDFKFVPKAADLTKQAASKTAFFIREMFSKKEESPSAFDFLSPPKEEKRQENGKVCPTA